MKILKKNNLLNALKKSSPTLFTLVKELFNCCDYKTSFYYISREVWLGKSRKLICTDQSRFCNFSHCRNWKIVSITSKCFSFFNNDHLLTVAHITRDFLTCYFYSFYSSMIRRNLPDLYWRIIRPSVTRWNQILCGIL